MGEQDLVKNKVVKEGDKWYVRSKDGNKNLGGPYDTEQEAKERLQEVEYFKHAKKNTLVVMKSKSNAQVRKDTMEGKEFTVVPMVMLVEGVHNGSCGALYYPQAELEKTPQAWNHKPVVVYHPDGPTACTPEILTNRKIGVVMNTKWEEGRLKAEAWLDNDRMAKVDNRVAEAVEKGTTLELSTGLFTDTEGPAGDWNNEHYDAIAKNYRPDHLAVLPDMVGACSVADGAGFLRLNAEKKDNGISQAWADTYFPVLQAAGIDTTKLTANELSHSDIWRQLNALIQGKQPNTGDGLPKVWYYLNEVYPDYCVYEADKGQLYKQAYEVKKDVVTLTGMPEEVVRVVSYKVKNTETVTNMENKMNKNDLITKLLSNEQSGWKAEDKAVLESMTDKQLETLAAKIPEKKVENEQKEEPKPAPKVENTEKPVVNTDLAPKVETPAKPLTAQEYINAAPPEIQNVLKEGLSAFNAEKEKLITVITGNKQNPFTKEFLATKNLDELRGLAKLAATEPAKAGDPVQMFNYSGQADVANATNGANVPILDLPVMSFAKDSK